MSESTEPSDRQAIQLPDYVIDFLKSVESIIQYRDHILAIPILLYVLGFVITNLHLGSIGVVTFDLLRVRYIVVGAMFALFAASIVLFLRGLLPRIVSDKPLHRRLLSAIGYSFSVYAAASIIVWILRPLSGTSFSPAVWLPAVGNATNILEITLGDPEQWIRKAATTTAIILGVYTLGFLIVLALGNRIRRTGEVTRKEILRGGLKGYLYILTGLALIGINLALFNYLIDYRESRSIGAPRQGAVDWGGFVTAHMLVYLLAAIYITISSLTPLERGSKDDSNSSVQEDRRLSLWHHFPLSRITLILITGTLIPTYALSAYPGIPQQLGGGAVIPAEILMVEDAENPSVSYCDEPTFIVDRSPRSVIVVKLIDSGEDIAANEIMYSEIRSIRFYPACPTSGT